MLKLANSLPLFFDGNGLLLTGGFVYVGVASADPELHPVGVYWDKAFTTPAEQPLRTQGGLIVNGASPASVYVDAGDYSLRVRDAYGSQVIYTPSAIADATVYQPVDDDLTAIANLGTTAYGRALLTLANQAALQAAVGAGAALPLAGGTVTGNITRQGAGSHLYHVNAAYTSGRVFGPEYTTDPTTLPGDVWFKPNG